MLVCQDDHGQASTAKDTCLKYPQLRNGLNLKPDNYAAKSLAVE